MTKGDGFIIIRSNYNNLFKVLDSEIPEVETMTTSELLRPISGRRGLGGVMTRPPKRAEETCAEAEVRDELERRIEGLFEGRKGLETCEFEFGKFMQYGTDDVFVVEVSVASHSHCDMRLVQRALEDCDFVNSVALIGLVEEGEFEVTFDVRGFESQLVEGGEPAGVYVDGSPLTIDQITRSRLCWANRLFNEAVRSHVGGVSTTFECNSLTEVDGHLRVHAYTLLKRGDELLSTHVSQEKPLGFFIEAGEDPDTYGVYLHISFEDFKKLLPSTVVDEERAGMLGVIGGVRG